MYYLTFIKPDNTRTFAWADEIEESFEVVTVVGVDGDDITTGQPTLNLIHECRESNQESVKSYKLKDYTEIYISNVDGKTINKIVPNK